MVGLLKVILSLGLHRSRRETRAREQLLGALCVVCVPARVHQTSRAYRAKMLAKTRWSTQNAERPRLLFRTALSDGMLRREAGGGVQLACGSLSPPCRAKLSEVGSASWLASQSALPAAHIICARTWGETTRSQYTVPRRTAPPLDGPSGRCASRQRPAEMSGRESPVLTRGVCLLTQASLGPDLV